MDVRPCPSLDEIESVIEDARGRQSFKIFFYRLEASGKGYHQSVPNGPNYWARKRCKGGVV